METTVNEWIYFVTSTEHRFLFVVSVTLLIFVILSFFLKMKFRSQKTTESATQSKDQKQNKHQEVRAPSFELNFNFIKKTKILIFFFN
jgi:uncharacterized membrane protein affecting hemolysin expression